MVFYPILGMICAIKSRKKGKNGERSMEMPQNDEVLTTAEAIRYLKISKPTFLKYIRLGKIREMEKEKGIQGSQEVKVLMQTSLEDSKNVLDAFTRGATSYIVKPVDGEKLLKEIRGFGFAV